jgi:hypothetical protein
MAANVLTRSEASARLIRRHADVTRLVDGDALAMFGLFGLSWAIPAAAVRICTALSSLLRRRLQHSVR